MGEATCGAVRSRMSPARRCGRRDCRCLLLHRAGWTIGDATVATSEGLVWLVWGRNGENLIRAEGRTRDEAWEEAVAQARAVGMCRN